MPDFVADDTRAPVEHALDWSGRIRGVCTAADGLLAIGAQSRGLVPLRSDCGQGR